MATWNECSSKASAFRRATALIARDKRHAPGPGRTGRLPIGSANGRIGLPEDHRAAARNAAADAVRHGGLTAPASSPAHGSARAIAASRSPGWASPGRPICARSSHDRRRASTSAGSMFAFGSSRARRSAIMGVRLCGADHPAARGPAAALTERIAAVGRAAFTNYLGTSILVTRSSSTAGGSACTRSRSARRAWLLVPLVWALMLLWSKPWLDRFRYGPFEWAVAQPCAREAAADAEALPPERPAKPRSGRSPGCRPCGRSPPAARGSAAGWSPCRTDRRCG